MKKRNKYLIDNIKILTLSNFSSKILVFLLVPLYTYVLTREEYGIYDLISASIQLLFPILTLNITDGLMRFLLDEDSNKSEVVSISFKFVMIGIFAGSLIGMGISFLPIFNHIQNIQVFTIIYYISFVFYQFLLQLAKGTENVKYMGTAGVLSTAIMIFCNIIFLVLLKLGLTGFLLAYIASQIVPAVYLAIKLKIWIYIDKRAINKELEKSMLLYSVPLIFTVIGWWINNVSDRYVVTVLLGVASNGLLSVAYKIPTIINTVQSIFIQAWQISAIKEYSKNDKEDFYSDTFCYLNTIIVLICSVLIIMTKPLANILYQKEFNVAWSYVPFLLVSSVINASAGYIGPILSAQKKSFGLAKSAIYGAVVNLLLNFILISYIGIQGATIATVISSFVIFQVRRMAVKDEINLRMYKPIMLSWILLCVQSYVEIYMGNYFLEIIIIFLILSVYIKSIFEMLKRIRFNE